MLSHRMETDEADGDARMYARGTDPSSKISKPSNSLARLRSYLPLVLVTKLGAVGGNGYPAYRLQSSANEAEPAPPERPVEVRGMPLP